MILRRVLKVIAGLLLILQNGGPLCVSCSPSPFREVFKWRLLDFAFAGGDEERQRAIEKGDYIKERNVPFGVQRWKDKVFITVPRRSPGIPATLSYVPYCATLGDGGRPTSPLLVPYPDWQTNQLPPMTSSANASCMTMKTSASNKERKGEEDEPQSHKLVSVYRVNVDACDRLWMIDTGEVRDFQGNGQKLQNPAIVVYDLMTGNLIRRHWLDEKVAPCGSVYTNVLVDVAADGCEQGNTYAYSADPATYALLVYDWKRDQSWRVKHSYFHIDPTAASFAIGGHRFQWHDGLFGIALVPPISKTGHQSGYQQKEKQEEERELYFHPMAATKEFSVPTKNVREGQRWPEIKIVGERGALGQSSASAFDRKSGVLFQTLVSQYAIGCWNRAAEPQYKVHKIYEDRDEEDGGMIYASDLKVNDDQLWVMTNRLPIVLYGSLRPDSFNFRVFSGDVQQLINGTACSAASAPKVPRPFWMHKDG